MKRPYVIINKETGEKLIVNASNKAQALRTMAELRFEAYVTNGAEVLEHLRKGVTIIESSETVPQPELPMGGE